MGTRENLKYLSKLVNKNVLVLGGTSGIGFAVAEAAVEYKAHVVVSGSNSERLEKTLQRLRGSYPHYAGNIVGFTADLADKDNVEENLVQLLDQATDNGSKKLDHVIVTAGDSLDFVTLKDVSPERVLPLFNVRLIAVVMLAKLLLHHGYMNLTSDSSLTLTSGTMVDKPGLGWAIPITAGAAVEGLTRGLAVDMQPLRVNCISPGAIHTELFARRGPEVEKAMVDGFAKETTLKKVGKPTDCAEAYLACMKDTFICGEVVRTNGGRMLV